MEQGILQTVGAVAGIGGVALLVFLWIFREVIRKNVFPRMSEDHGYRTIRLLMILATIVALAGIGAWFLAQSGVGPKSAVHRTLTVRMARVELDWEGATAAAKEFEGTDGGEVAESAIDAATRWILERLVAEDAMSPHDRVMVTMKLPADFATGNPSVAIVPAVPWTAYAAAVGGGGAKSRIPIGDSEKGFQNAGTWKPPTDTWELQIVPRGHEQIGVEIAPEATPPSVKLPSPRTPVGVALRDAEATAETASDRIMLRLVGDARLKLAAPEVLAALRTEIANAARAGESLAVQSTLRARLGVDYVVTCSVR